VIRASLFRTVGLICLLAAGVSFALPVESFSATQPSAATKPQAKPKKRLALKRTPTTKVRRTSASTAKARRAARQVADAQQPRFKLDENGALVPDVRAEAAIVYNPENGQILFESNSQEQRSIASITKVMTAIVFLERPLPDMTVSYPVEHSDVYQASTTHIRAGYEVTPDDLLHLMLIASDNAAARMLARISPYGAEGFVRRMNEKAKELGLTSTHYADPSGLLAANVSSAYDIARLISYVSGDERIASIMQTPYYTVNAGRHQIQIHSTDQLVRTGDVDVEAGKTGFISKAGYCLATLLRLPEGGPEVAVVVLGAHTSAGRFWETRHLFNWISSKASDMFGPSAAPSATTPAVVGASSTASN
jgi:D-alanyl-D-alanine endopeptidase (penicillin-binding protein 7)